MPSISSITQQYAKQQNKNTQKGGAILDFLNTDDKTTTNPQSTNQAKDATTTPTNAPPVVPPEDDKNFIEKAGDTIKRTFGLGESEKEESATATTPAKMNIEPTPPAESSKGFFSFGSDTKEETEPSVNKNAPQKPEEQSEDKGIFGFSFGSSNKTEETSNKGNSDNESGSGSETGSENESDTGSDTGNEEDNDDDFALIAAKMNSLHENYERLKQEHANLKAKMETQKVEQENKDNSQFSTLVAAFFAAEGSLTQLKKSLIEHASNNGYSLVGTGLDSGSANTEAVEEVSQAPSPAVPVSPPNDTVVEKEMSPVESVTPPATQDETLSSSQPSVGSETLASATDNNQLDANSSQASMNDAASISGSSDSEDSGSGSSSGTEDNEEGGIDEAKTDTLTQTSGDGQNPVQEIPVNEETPNVSAPPVMAAPSQSLPNTTFNGGRNSYPHSTNKNHKTHRHHKRRNRHQTLRSHKK